MEKITRYYFEHMRVSKSQYVRLGIPRAWMENQYQTFPPEDNFP